MSDFYYFINQLLVHNRCKCWLSLRLLSNTDCSDVCKGPEGEENTRNGLGHGPFHNDGQFLCSVLGLVYLAKVDTAAFSTDPYFGWPPVLAIQIAWGRVLRHQWSWEGQAEGRKQ